MWRMLPGSRFSLTLIPPIMALFLCACNKDDHVIHSLD